MTATLDRPISSGADATRRTRPRRQLPGGRAVAGGLLVGIAVLGTFLAATASDDAAPPIWVVAAHDLAPGSVIELDDLTTAPAELSEAMSARAFHHPDTLVGATLLGPLAAGELVQEGSLVRSSSDAGHHQISFPVDAELALAGDITPGERIDIIATIGTGDRAETDFVVRRALVAHLDTDDTGLDTSMLVITVALTDPADVVALAHAARSGELVVVRSPTGTAP